MYELSALLHYCVRYQFAVNGRTFTLLFDVDRTMLQQLGGNTTLLITKPMYMQKLEKPSLKVTLTFLLAVLLIYSFQFRSAFQAADKEASFLPAPLNCD